MSKKILKSKERKFISEREKHFRRMKKAVKKAINDFANENNKVLIKTEADDLTEKYSWEELQKKIKLAMKVSGTSMISSFPFFLDDLFDYNLEDEIIENIQSVVLRKFLRKLTSKSKSITNTIKKQINNTIKRELKNKTSTRELQAILNIVFEDIAEKRSSTVARTEVNDVANDINHIEGMSAPGIKYKTWLHTGAGKTFRDSHVALDGTRIAKNKYFLVDGTFALYPHDPVLPLDEKINCHCYCYYT